MFSSVPMSLTAASSSSGVSNTSLSVARPIRPRPFIATFVAITVSPSTFFNTLFTTNPPGSILRQRRSLRRVHGEDQDRGTDQQVCERGSSRQAPQRPAPLGKRPRRLGVFGTLLGLRQVRQASPEVGPVGRHEAKNDPEERLPGVERGF